MTMTQKRGDSIIFARRLKPWRAAKILALVLAFRGLAGSEGFAAVAAGNVVEFEQVLSRWIVQTDGTRLVEAGVTIRPPPENPSRARVVPRPGPIQPSG